MLSPLAPGTYFGFPEPMQSQANLDRVNVQILTGDFERLHTRGIEEISETKGGSAIRAPVDEHERGGILAAFEGRFKPPLHFQIAMLEGEGGVERPRAAVSFRPGAGYARSAYRLRADVQAGGNLGGTVNVVV